MSIKVVAEIRVYEVDGEGVRVKAGVKAPTMIIRSASKSFDFIELEFEGKRVMVRGGDLEIAIRAATVQ